ncbi:MAG: ribosome recycling factor [Saprospiraceae bacterium]
MAVELGKQMDDANELMDKAVEHLTHELGKVRTGKANASMVQDIKVLYYGNPTPLNQVANVSLADSRTLTIQPWEKSSLGPIEKSIFEANLGLTPINDGDLIRVSIPPLTEERRKDLVKQARSMGEEAKVAVRNVRHKYLDVIKKAVKDGTPEDMGKSKETALQEKVNHHVDQVDKMIKHKEEEIMKV